LRSKNYYIFNKVYSKDEYAEELKKIASNTPEGLAKAKERFNQLPDIN
jgi:hypothetical protein